VVPEHELEESFNGPITWSPDDRKLAFMFAHAGREADEIFVVNADGTKLRRVAVTSRFDGAAAWRPRSIAGRWKPPLTR
jgi:Tol biopolymer transport system component